MNMVAPKAGLRVKITSPIRLDSLAVRTGRIQVTSGAAPGEITPGTTGMIIAIRGERVYLDLKEGNRYGLYANIDINDFGSYMDITDEF